MDSDEDYGDLDDTAFMDAATQFDEANTHSFRSSPRPPKLPKLDLGDGGTSSIPPRFRRQHNKRRRPFVDSDSESDSVHPAAPARHTTRRTFAKPSSQMPSARPERAFVPPLPSEAHLSDLRGSSESLGANDDAQGQDGHSALRKPIITAKKDRIHTPTTVVELTDVYYTQPPLEDSPPWKTRGAIWSKTLMTLGVHRDRAPPVQRQTARPNAMTLAVSHSTLSRQCSRRCSRPPTPPEDSDLPVITGSSIGTHHEKSPTLSLDGKMDPEKYDLAQELADLPSDAFASSSVGTQEAGNDAAQLLQTQPQQLASQAGLRQTTLYDRSHDQNCVPRANKGHNFNAVRKNEPTTHHALDLEATKTWVYPTNLGITRDYQFNIVARGLFHNLLVALPTGLGKTFIAATVMLNWFRWTVDAQIVFVAPTKPLVAQQIEACFGIAGIPRSQTTMLTGGVSPALRAQEWANKRVFFMTPQTLNNDLKSGIADPKRIVLLVVDEAHKATGSYAYTEVVSLMRRFNPSYRILALTATPGSDVESVQKVIDGLDISRIEIRTENSLDIRQYIHQRKVEKKVFENSDEMQMCMDLYSEALQPLVKKLQGLNAFWTHDPLALTPYGCTQSRQKYFKEVGRGVNQGIKSMVHAIFSVLASISQGMELLKYHGIRPFYVKMKDFRDSTTEGKSKYKKEVCDSKAFKTLMVRLETWSAIENFTGHPKLEYLIQVTLEHFSNAAEGGDPSDRSLKTRIMVFAHWRDSAEEIVRVLKKHQPMIRPKVFVGQSSAKNSEGMLQSEQLKAIDDFKNGIYNTLVATCIGEEGLDIGEVDLIVCYDSKASPIRMLQRMGRTGRKRQGKVILMQMKGKEENDALKAKDSYEKMQELIAEGSRFTFHDDVSRRILPKESQPVVDKRVVDIPLENSQSGLPEPRKRGKIPKRPPKKFHMPDNVITGFVTAARMDEEVPTRPYARRTAAVGSPSDELHTIPPLDAVVLDSQQEDDLGRRYQTVFDDEEQPTIGAVDMQKYPTRQRILSRTEDLPPGRATQRFVKMLQNINAIDEAHIQRLRLMGHDFEHHIPTVADIRVGSSSGVRQKESGGDEHAWNSDGTASETHLLHSNPISSSRLRCATAVRSSSPPKSIRKKTSIPRTSADSRSRREIQYTTPTPQFRISDDVEEGADSSPPPTDPRMRLPSQTIDLGSDDTLGDEEVQDTQAYLLDSDLRDFIAEDDEDLEAADSSLPSLHYDKLGQGTQSVVKNAKPRRLGKLAKIFSSDPTDDDAIVSSDSDDDLVLQGHAQAVQRSKHSAVEAETSAIIKPAAQPRKRKRRVVEEDDSDDG